MTSYTLAFNNQGAASGCTAENNSLQRDLKVSPEEFRKFEERTRIDIFAVISAKNPERSYY